MADEIPKGLIIVNTGDGKGKTTAALGLAMRAVGHEFKTLMIQFIKSPGQYGELKIIEKLAPYLEIRTMGKGFLFRKDRPAGEDISAVKEAWDYFEEALASGKYDLIILDEINIVIKYKLIDVQKVVDILDSKPENLHLVLTGRNAHQEIIQRADLVTEMQLVKHPYKKGIKAQKGIEF